MRLLAVTALLLIFAAPLRAQLPPQAQEALDKGVIAAKVPDYPLAIRYFEEARKLAPLAPVVYLNMGLAESRISGRELRAMAWFGAYLAAVPDAPNAPAVKEQIALLEVRQQSNTLRLVKSVQDAADRISSDSVEKGANLRDLAGLLAGIGDFAEAVRISGSIQQDPYRRTALSNIIQAQARRGDIAGALQTARLLGGDDYHHGHAYLEIVEAQAKRGDVAGALKTRDLIRGDNEFAKNQAYSRIVGAQATRGDFSGAFKTVELAPNADWKAAAYSSIAGAQARSGDIKGALKTLESVQRTGSWDLRAIAEAQVKAGDIPGARKTAGLIQERHAKAFAQADIAQAEARSGDVASARKTFVEALETARLYETASSRAGAQAYIADRQRETGDVKGARQALEFARESAELEKDARFKGSALSYIARVEAKVAGGQPTAPTVDAAWGWIYLLVYAVHEDASLNDRPFLDLPGHLKTLPSSGDAQKSFQALQRTAATVVRAQNAVIEKLKQQAQTPAKP